MLPLELKLATCEYLKFQKAVAFDFEISKNVYNYDKHTTFWAVKFKNLYALKFLYLKSIPNPFIHENETANVMEYYDYLVSEKNEAFSFGMLCSDDEE